ncbi:MAG: GTPase Era [Pseudomonadota bacterium]
MSEHRTGFVAIVGRPNVGKSTLLNHLVGQKISITSRKAQTTRHRISAIRSDADVQFIFVDTPGFQTQNVNTLNRMLNRSVTQSLQNVDAVLFVIEALKFGARDREVLKLIPVDKPVILVINKIDHVAEKAMLLPFIESMTHEFTFAAIVPVSAQHNTHLEELLHALAPCLPQGPAIFDEDTVTDKSERFFAAEFIREKLFRFLGEELPYSTSVVIEQFQTEGKLRRIHAAIIVDKPGQKAIVIGRKGEKLKEIASQARQDMEKLFGSKVFLEIWVKVKSGWADDERTLRSFGYE